MDKQPTDAQLLANWQAGNSQAGHALYTRYYQTTERFFRGRIPVKSDSYDLTQQTFLAVTEKQNAIQEFAPFLFRVRSCRLHDYYRRQYRKGHSESYETQQAKQTGLETRVNRGERKLAVREALKQLPERLYEVLWLHYADGLTNVQIAEILEIPVGTVKSRLRAGREQLAKSLANIKTGVPSLSEIFQLRPKN